MKFDFKSSAGLYWVIGVIAASMMLFVYLLLSDAPRTLPKISLSYFTDEQEVVDSIEKRLHLELSQAKSFWIGIEPDKKEQLLIVQKLKEIISKNGPFQKVIVDKELAMEESDLKALGATEILPLKVEIFKLGEEIEALQKENIPYLVITASIYSTSLLPGNPIHRLREKMQIQATTFSFGYFPTSLEDEKKLLFACNTEDHSGIKDWGCFVVNKSRAARRKFKAQNDKAWAGLMDMSGERDYVVLLKKRQ